jgi:hypothetical protein
LGIFQVWPVHYESSGVLSAEKGVGSFPLKAFFESTGAIGVDADVQRTWSGIW